MARYALLPFVGTGTREDAFRPLGLRAGIDYIDLRSDYTTAEGWALASIQDGLELPRDAVHLADSMEAPLAPRAKAALASELRAPLPDMASLDSMLVAMLTLPPPGRWGRLQADARGLHRITLGDWQYEAPAPTAFYGEEHFAKGDSSIIGPTFTWTKTEGNWQILGQTLVPRSSAANDFIRCDSAVTDTDNMFCDLEWTTAGPNLKTLAPLARYADNAQTFYFFELRSDGDIYYFGRKVNNAWTYFRQGVATPNPPGTTVAPPLRLRVSCDGSTIRGWINSYLVDTWTDTGIPTGRRGGVFSHNGRDESRVEYVIVGDIRTTKKISTFSEDFDTLDAVVWDFNALAQAVDGELRLEQRSEYPTVSSDNRYDLSASSVGIKITSPNPASGSGREDWIELLEAPDNYVLFGQTGGSLIARVRTGGRNDDTALAFDADQHLWRRISERGGFIYFDTSPDGKDWTARAQKAITWTPGNMRIRLVAGDFDTQDSPLPVARFDKLNLFPRVWASDTAYTVLRADVNTVKKDTSVDGNPIKIRGVTHAKGFGTHATSDIRVPVSPGAVAFKATIGIDDESVPNSAGEAVWEVWNADKTTLLYQSPSLTWESAPLDISVDVRGHSEIRLWVDQGAVNTWDHADWASARFESLGALLLGGTLELTGTVIKRLGRIFTGSTTPYGTANAMRIVLRTFTGSLTAAGTLLRGARKLLVGSSTATGGFIKVPQKVLTAGVSAGGFLDWTPAKILTGTIASTGSTVITHLGRVLGRAGTAIMRIRPAGEIRMRFRRR